MAVESVVNRAAAVDRSFRREVGRLAERPGPARLAPDAPVRRATALTAREALALFEAMCTSRQLDFAARELKAKGAGYYTIGSAGHEGNAVLGARLRLDDVLFLHYRSGALVQARARLLPGETPIMDVALSLCASAEDPISGGRHKVFGSKALNVPPQTSTIASHLPKAVGCALGLERRTRLGLLPAGVPGDSISVATFGDASVNHATAVTAINAALHARHRGESCPVLFVCEDNGLGISVPTPNGWIESQYGRREDLVYVAGDGLDLADAWDAAGDAIDICRTERRPVFLHLRTVRLLGHAGSDVETEYHSLAEIEAAEALDPLPKAAALLVESGAATADEVLAIYEDARVRVTGAAREAAGRRRLESVAEIVAPLATPSGEAVRAEAARDDYGARRAAIFGGADKLPEHGRPRHLAALVATGLADLLAKYPELVVFGEDVGKKGGVYHATADLQRFAGADRVFDTLLDETTILGTAIGFAHTGLLPCPEIQYLAYLHNAEDQLRGEAASLSFFSDGRFKNGMVVRVAGLGYQKGFGGHFHNDDAVAVLRDVPGIAVGVPATGADAVEMQRVAFAAAKVDGRVTVLLEPIALYMTKDLHAPGDGGFLRPFPAPGTAAEIGKGRVAAEEPDADLSILTYGNGLWLSLRAAKRLATEGIRARVTDLRWLLPIDTELCVREAEATGRVLIVDECRRTAGPSEQIVTAEDTFVPLGPAAELVLPSEDGIVGAARTLVGGAPRARRRGA